jgi:hypothetical protein
MSYQNTLMCHCGWRGNGDETNLDGNIGEQPWMTCPNCGTWLVQIPNLLRPEPTAPSVSSEALRMAFMSCAEHLEKVVGSTMSKETREEMETESLRRYPSTPRDESKEGLR